jgi:hypothetical protein
MAWRPEKGDGHGSTDQYRYPGGGEHVGYDLFHPENCSSHGQFAWLIEDPDARHFRQFRFGGDKMQ